MRVNSAGGLSDCAAPRPAVGLSPGFPGAAPSPRSGAGRGRSRAV
ncbi:hypothetical protein HMPREF0043_01268 [Actinobaculum sp. oral taxon 183 str. F0552]|nr:hypothetical protein HMPREF0043_01268 [Actinobaculum sp. oral taxon 183 str. F0552]